MKLEALILAAVAVLAAGCPSTWNCDPPSENFSVDEATLTEAELSEVMSDWGFDTRAEISCDVACGFAYRRDRGWESSDVTSCTLALAEPPGAKPEDPGATITCKGRGIQYFCEGRRPIGHVELAGGDGSLAEHLGRCAHLEAASETAFVELAARLERLGAPASLRRRCLEAAADEARHAALVGEHARRAGAQLVAPVHDAKAPDLLAVAIDNAVEGCVHEAWAAVRAAWSARTAEDPALRELYAAIAADEARHAQLAWDLHAWLMGQLAGPEQAVVRRAQEAALARLPEIAAWQAASTPPGLGRAPMLRAEAAAASFAASLRAAA